ncbi:MAG: class A beta-lactamase-related serine hydrolase [Chloroflexota bacterium]|nr:MAG: class A beta-lactamase-related serine hydrolase [Chloroflexota bacterium]
MPRIISLITLLVLALVPLHAQAQEQDPFAARMQEQMPGLLAAHHVPGAIVAYIRNGDVAWTQAYGVANTRTGEAMQPEMIMNFGSCGKVLTAWGVMRLVETGQVNLDAPANQYLKRWQIESSQFDPSQVTVRRLLSHTGGLSAPGFSDYSHRRRMPTLVEMLEGKNQMDGRVDILWQPGTQFHYSGGGFVLLQMIIEDVTGESFADFMQREVAAPLGISSLSWAWTPALEQAAAMPHASQGEPVGYRQLASYAIGSELSTTADFARFIAATVEGPNGEPAGRGVLSPETVREMITSQPNTGGESGLAYGLAAIGGDQTVMHFGSNLGWNAFFILDTGRREGVVMATNSANGFSLLTAVQNLWVNTALGDHVNVYPPPADLLGFQGRAALIIAGALGAAWALAALVFGLQIRSGWRQVAKLSWPRLLGVLPWALLALFWCYWIYVPYRGLLPTTFPEVWPIPQAAYVMAALLAWVVLAVAMALFPRKPRMAPGERQVTASG